METFVTLSSDFNPYLFWISTAIAGVILLLTFTGYRESRQGAGRIWLIVIRFFAVALILFVSLNPVIKKDRVMSSKNVIPVIVDNSISLNLVSGHEKIKTWLKSNRDYFDSLGEKHSLIFHDIYGNVITDPAGENVDLEPKAQSTDILKAIENSLAGVNKNELAGMIVVSDGMDNGILSNGMNDEGVIEEDLRLKLLESRAPVHTFEVPVPSLVKDVFIERVEHPPFAFVKNFSGVRVFIGGRGFDGMKARVVLSEEGNKAAEKEVTLNETLFKEGTEIEFLPLIAGARLFDVSVLPLDGEVTVRNNHFPFFMDILREKIRVLHVAGRPSWDVPFMREFLRQNGNIDLISFFVLVHSSGLEYDSESGKVLIPFPAEELFVNELRGFDLLVIQDYLPDDFNAGKFGSELLKFVEEGGGLLVTGGKNMTGNALSEFLGQSSPFRFDGIAGGSGFIHEDISVEVNPGAADHPVIKTYGGGDLAAQIRKAPALEGLSLFAGVKEGGSVILRDSERKYPVLAAGAIGNGKAAMFATDSFWKWKFTAGMRKDLARVYDGVMTNLLNYLTGGGTDERLEVSVSNREVFTGGKNVVSVKANAAADKIDVDFSFSLLTPGKPLDFMKFRRDALRGSEGAIEMAPEISGVYLVEAYSETKEGKAAGSARFIAKDNSAELRPGRSVLKHISNATGGRSLTVDYVNPPLNFREPVKYHVATVWIWELWNFWGILVIIVTLLSAEWYLRRKFGLS
ncbi:MAG: hypothetical protein FJ088_04215 [Deltaproteobacteria bacterium]|nr:hypothetical protein [Deltaproteobacteria bacterium]